MAGPVTNNTCDYKFPSLPQENVRRHGRIVIINGSDEERMLHDVQRAYDYFRTIGFAKIIVFSPEAPNRVDSDFLIRRPPTYNDIDEKIHELETIEEPIFIYITGHAEQIDDSAGVGKSKFTYLKLADKKSTKSRKSTGSGFIKLLPSDRNKKNDEYSGVRRREFPDSPDKSGSYIDSQRRIQYFNFSPSIQRGSAKRPMIVYDPADWQPIEQDTSEYITVGAFGYLFKNFTKQPITFLFSNCFGGNFVEELKGQNRLIMSNSTMDGRAYGTAFDWYFFMGSRNLMDADYNNQISHKERFDFALKMYGTIVGNDRIGSSFDVGCDYVDTGFAYAGYHGLFKQLGLEGILENDAKFSCAVKAFIGQNRWREIHLIFAAAIGKLSPDKLANFAEEVLIPADKAKKTYLCKLVSLIVAEHLLSATSVDLERMVKEKKDFLALLIKYAGDTISPEELFELAKRTYIIARNSNNKDALSLALNAVKRATTMAVLVADTSQGLLWLIEQGETEAVKEIISTSKEWTVDARDEIINDIMSKVCEAKQFGLVSFLMRLCSDGALNADADYLLECYQAAKPDN